MNDIPLEAVLKYIKKERDKYKAKLENLVPYTKALEQKVKDLDDIISDKEKRIADLEKRLEENEIKKGEYNQAIHDNKFMKEELDAFRKDYRKTEWYKQLEDARKALRADNKKLRETLMIVGNKRQKND